MRKRSDLTEQQVNTIELLQREMCHTIWAKPGNGKTVIALTAVEDTYPAKCLIVGTPRICELVWRQETTQWEHLQHVRPDMEWLKGGSVRAREKILQQDSLRYHLLSYDLLHWMKEVYKGQKWPYDAIIFDEITKLKSPGSRRFKAVRHNMNHIPMRIGLTGTPRGNSLLGLWSQMYAISGPVLGRTYTHYKKAHFYPVDDLKRIWRPEAGAEADIRAEAKPYAVALPPDPSVKLAALNPREFVLPSKARKLYDTLETELEITVDGHEIRGMTPEALRDKHLQICSGSIYVSPAHEKEKKWVDIHNEKIDTLYDLIDEINGDQLLVFYRYRHEMYRMKDRFGKDMVTASGIDDWLAGKRQLLVLHPEQGAHGLNLHVGGATQKAWFTMPDSQENWEQGNARLARKGQTKDVVSHILCAKDTREDALARGLRDHTSLQNLLMKEAERFENHGT